MFDATELEILMTALDAEARVLRAFEEHGVPMVRQLAIVATLKAKVADALEAESKKAATVAAKEAS